MALQDIQAWLAMPYTRQLREKLDRKKLQAEKDLRGKPFRHPDDIIEVAILQELIKLADTFLDDVDKELATELRHEKANRQ